MKITQSETITEALILFAENEDSYECEHLAQTARTVGRFAPKRGELTSIYRDPSFVSLSQSIAKNINRFTDTRNPSIHPSIHPLLLISIVNCCKPNNLFYPFRFWPSSLFPISFEYYICPLSYCLWLELIDLLFWVRKYKLSSSNTNSSHHATKSGKHSDFLSVLSNGIIEGILAATRRDVYD